MRFCEESNAPKGFHSNEKVKKPSADIVDWRQVGRRAGVDDVRHRVSTLQTEKKSGIFPEHLLSL